MCRHRNGQFHVCTLGVENIGDVCHFSIIFLEYRSPLVAKRAGGCPRERRAEISCEDSSKWSQALLLRSFLYYLALLFLFSWRVICFLFAHPPSFFPSQVPLCTFPASTSCCPQHPWNLSFLLPLASEDPIWNPASSPVAGAARQLLPLLLLQSCGIQIPGGCSEPTDGLTNDACSSVSVFRGCSSSPRTQPS